MVLAYPKQIIKNQSTQNSEKSSYYQRVLTEELLWTSSFGHHSRQTSEQQ